MKHIVILIAVILLAFFLFVALQNTQASCQPENFAQISENGVYMLDAKIVNGVAMDENYRLWNLPPEDGAYFNGNYILVISCAGTPSDDSDDILIGVR